MGKGRDHYDLMLEAYAELIYGHAMHKKAAEVKPPTHDEIAIHALKVCIKDAGTCTRTRQVALDAILRLQGKA